MAASDRLFGWDVTTVVVGTGEFLARFTNCKLSESFETVFSRATKDTTDGTVKGFEYHRQKSKDASLTLGAVVDSADSAHHLIKQAITGGPIACVVSKPGGSTYTGIFVFTAASLDFPDAAALQDATLVAFGPLGVT